MSSFRKAVLTAALFAAAAGVTAQAAEKYPGVGRTATAKEVAAWDIDVRPDFQRDKDDLTMSVTFRMAEAPRVYVERINVRGNTRTSDYVIRRELEAVGETYRSNQYYAAVSHPLTRAVTLDATYTYLDADRSGADAQLLSVRATYSFSRRTAVYALAGHVFNGSRVAYSVSGGSAVPASPGVGQGQTGLMAGLRHQF